MKTKIFILALMLFSTSCQLDIAPFDSITNDNLASVPNALEYATNGTYSLMKDHISYRGVDDFRSQYIRNLHMMLEYAGDNVTLSGTTTDPLFVCATREHYPSQENSTYVWYVGYKIINTANLNIESVEKDPNPDNNYLLGENYFMRAVAYFDLLRVFARPYTHGVNNDGLPLRLAGYTEAKYARSTVGECYEQVEKDLLKAAELMETGTSRGIEYGSKEAAWALLSRLYLYMENNDKAIEYASKVIASPRFTLEPNATYLNLFHNSPNSTESIFIIKSLLQDDRGSGSIGSMYLTDGIGWGEVYTSQPLYDLLQQHPEDVRISLIKPQLAGDNVTVVKRNGIPKYFITKFSYQDGIVTLSSPHYVRLAEMYLNRAEANAKKGNDDDAIADINIIRGRAGLSGSLYSLGNLQGASSVLNAVLQERRLELAYEGHRTMDVYRNKLNMDRTFPGVQPKVSVSWEDNRNIYFIPQDELLINDVCAQNP